MTSRPLMARPAVLMCSLPALLVTACREAPVPAPPPAPEPQVTAPPAAPAPAVKTSGYVFTVDGKTHEPTFFSLGSLTDEPGPGDVAQVWYRAVFLREPGEYQLKTTDFRDGRLLAVGPDGTETLFAFDLSRHLADEQSMLTRSTFDSIEIAQVPGTWGIEVDSWGPQAEAVLAAIDPVRTCLTITHETVQPPDMTLPPLPGDLRCLVIREGAAPGGFLSLAGLTALDELRYLEVDVMSLEALDARWFEKATKLRYLAIRSSAPLEHPEALGALDELISLDLSQAGGVDTVEFVADLSALRRLDVSWTKVSDLSPIARAAALEQVYASGSGVEILPRSKATGLRELRVVSTKLNDSAVARFRRLNPGCEVWHRWADALQSATRGATRLRVRTGGTCHTHPELEKTIAVVEDSAAVRDFLGHIEVLEKESGGACACCGSPTFEIYRGDVLVAALSFHHGKTLRWSEGWPGDAKLTSGSGRYLVEWLAAKGHGLPRALPDETP